jgi:hypothetical protein
MSTIYNIYCGETRRDEAFCSQGGDFPIETQAAGAFITTKRPAATKEHAAPTADVARYVSSRSSHT